MKDMLAFDYVVDLSRSTISRHLLNQLYSVKQNRGRDRIARKLSANQRADIVAVNIAEVSNPAKTTLLNLAYIVAGALDVRRKKNRHRLRERS
ncbi:hypothetical protein PybrP1_006149 [[Pythium] brassicae (nom. inval.)]|nr:hypothetical protein PybrP1_006149 [[Pythium] brassicae (nom. inval.)]